ncbi:MAG: hypothetical protein J6P40_00950, partial [Oscillospiraceae bacterium]|nr:hypothetical protein [Oscillospiraceae bacterium]
MRKIGRIIAFVFFSASLILALSYVNIVTYAWTGVKHNDFIKEVLLEDGKIQTNDIKKKQKAAVIIQDMEDACYFA